eukprot:2069478-Rhodomonas_salina.4
MPVLVPLPADALLQPRAVPGNARRHPSLLHRGLLHRHADRRRGSARVAAACARQLLRDRHAVRVDVSAVVQLRLHLHLHLHLVVRVQIAVALSQLLHGRCLRAEHAGAGRASEGWAQALASYPRRAQSECHWQEHAGLGETRSQNTAGIMGWVPEDKSGGLTQH